VLVGEATRRATEAAVVYADAGVHQLKGKAEPVPLWRAERVVAGRGGTLRAAGLEAPFTGRERELRLVKELFHATAEERRARLVAVEGVGGIGKSRLAWEFEKYIDGLLEDVWWHRGRCLAYGEGVSYWALAEMVRMRAEILEAEPPATAMAKLAVAVDEHVADPEERRWILPRLAHLLGLEELAATERDDLFSAWRRFFERLSQRGVTVLVFEDLQWADAGLLDFIDHLLDWSSAHPLYVLVLARPELYDRHPGWAARRRATSIPLGPLPAPQMEELLAGLVPGLPDGLRRQILDRAEGIPLYAVETVRMLLDRGLLERHGDRHRVAGAIEDLEVPETLHALIAARLDGLAPSERRLLQDGAVLGKTFTGEAVAALGGGSPERLEPLLGGLVRKELLSIQADPRSPERGQYGFLQDLVRRVAYETLARRDRRERHLAAAAHLEAAWGAKEDEIVEVVAGPLPGGVAGRPRHPGRGRDQGQGDRAAGRGRPAGGLAGRRRRGPALLRAGGRAGRRPGGQGRPARAGRPDGLDGRGGRGRRGPVPPGDRAVRCGRPDPSGGPGVGPPWRGRLDGRAPGGGPGQDAGGVRNPGRGGARRGPSHPGRPAGAPGGVHRRPRRGRRPPGVRLGGGRGPRSAGGAGRGPQHQGLNAPVPGADQRVPGPDLPCPRDRP